MKQSFERISNALILPQKSRERIRSQLAAYERPADEVPRRKTTLRSRVSVIAAVAAVMMVLVLSAGAVAVQLFRNDVVVSGEDDIPAPTFHTGAPGGYVISKPSGEPPATLEEMIASARMFTEEWDSEESINGGIYGYSQWDTLEVLSSDPTLRTRRIGRKDGAEKLEHTAEDPTNLLDTLTGNITFDLAWMNDHYDFVPDANMTSLICDKSGSLVIEFFRALYAKKDGTGYVDLSFDYIAQADYFGQAYVLEDSYETAYYYTSADGLEYLITMDNGNVWVECRTSHASISMRGAYLTTTEVEDILDNLSIAIQE